MSTITEVEERFMDHIRKLYGEHPTFKGVADAYMKVLRLHLGTEVIETKKFSNVHKAHDTC